MNLATASRTWSFPKRMCEDLIAFSTLIWLGFMIVFGAFVIGLDRWGTVNNSYWESFSQFIPWFTLFIGVHIGSTLFPISIAHGKTRRDFSIETAIFLLVYSTVISVFILIGWLFERAQYSLMDLPQVLTDEHIFT
ncbi:MAG: hypothetical protein ACRDHN_06580, partial [Thermomicrobiales bacterium]